MENREKWKELAYSAVTIEDAYYQNAYQKECAYLMELEPDRLLCGFRETAGLEAKAKRYPGWEITEIQGHTLGHYLSALAQAYAYSKEEQFLERIHYIIRELKSCQQITGYLFASDKEIFDRVENRQPAWVPWYTMHKIMEGLLLAYELADSEEALEIAEKLGNWIFIRCSTWDEEKRNTVLSVEYGGMNDCLYELFKLTDNYKYMEAAHAFDELPLFTAMAENRDILNGLHANTTIPKILGALNRYEAVGEEWYLTVAENFWEMVISHHTYITGGNSEWEHFGRPDILDAERTACNCETCNTYNMLKLTKKLYTITGEKKYADYYERCLTNAILSSQNPKTGMTMYFQPMATGYFKAYSTPFDKFWCCTGTGMENFTKLSEGIYFVRDGGLYINRFIRSTVRWDEAKIQVSVEADFPESEEMKLQIHGCPDKETKLHIRIPDWAAGPVKIIRGESTEEIEEHQRELILSNLLQEETIRITFPMELRWESLKDNPSTVAFAYGPVVLSAKMGAQMMNCTTTGVDVTVPKKEFFLKDYIVITGDPMDWLSNLKNHLEKRPGKVEFVLKETENKKELVFVQHYRQYEERYGIYFRIYQKGSGELLKCQQMQEKKIRLEKEAMDIVPVGNDQYELAHRIRGEKTDTCIFHGHRCRFIDKGGYVEYQMKIEESEAVLCMTCYTQEAEPAPEILINGKAPGNGTLLDHTEDGFEVWGYPVENNGNNTLNVRFHNTNKEICRIYDEVYIRQAN